MSVDTERVRKLYDNSAARYDRKITVPERLLFGLLRELSGGLPRPGCTSSSASGPSSGSCCG